MSKSFQINQYTLQEKIGDGGMAEVFLAYNHQLEKYAAIKRLKPEFVNSSNIRGRFIAEARSLITMNHPNVVKVYGILEEEGFVGAVMEFVDGQTLDMFVESKKCLSNNLIRELLFDMIEALKYVHRVGLIHRDIKPSNFMVDEKNRVKLLDFGIAKNLNEQLFDYTQTGMHQQMGTPLYMSPEQVARPDRVTQLTDMYSLGVVIYFLVKGESPYDKTAVSLFELQSKIVHEKLPSTNTIWDEVIGKATEKDPTKRFQTDEEILNAIQKLTIDDTAVDSENKTHSIFGRILNWQYKPDTKVKFLSPLSDFPFKKEDFINEFEHFQNMCPVLWFEEVRELGLCKFNMVEYLMEDVEAIGIRIAEKEFYIGTMGGYWAVFSNFPGYDAFYFRDAEDKSDQIIMDFLLKKLCLPDGFANACLKMMRKYEKLK